jgi:hypothetical protein
LLDGISQSTSEILIIFNHHVKQINLLVLESKICFLFYHVINAKFMGSKQRPSFLIPWLTLLNVEVKGGRIYLKGNLVEATINVPMKSPFESEFGSCAFHPWVLAYNLETQLE